MVEGWPYINNLILVIKHEDLIALAWIIYEAITVVNEPHVTDETIEFQKCIAIAESI